MSIDFESKTTFGDDDDDDKYIKTKIKTYKDSITTNFYNKIGSKKVPEEKIPHECLSIIILDVYMEITIHKRFKKNVNM